MFPETLIIGILIFMFLNWWLRAQQALDTEGTNQSSGVAQFFNNNATSGKRFRRPSRHDIYHVAFLLQQKLPPELVPQILDHAEYWLRSRVSLTHEISVMEVIHQLATNHMVPGATYISSLPIGEVPYESENGIALVGQHPVRKVEFAIESRDQGWSNFQEDHGTERNSWTWFEALVREANEPRYQDVLAQMAQDDSEIPTPPAGMKVANNIHAGRDWHRRVVNWSITSEDDQVRQWVRQLKRGQVIDLTMWARYPGWKNRVKSAGIYVYVAAVR